LLANWITGELFGLLNQSGTGISQSPVSPASLAGLVQLVVNGEINQTTAKMVLSEMFTTGTTAREIVAERGLQQISETGQISELVSQALTDHPQQVAEFLSGKTALARWLFGQVMRNAKGQANPAVVQQELDRQLEALRLRDSEEI
jgi:aspartyl-tRNA(Asn)/glutamyl-tRNA(Gln) amidotransferase subunit B